MGWIWFAKKKSYFCASRKVCLVKYIYRYGVARMVKLVDTPDLKSCGHCGRAGSIPAPGTEKPYSQ